MPDTPRAVTDAPFDTIRALAVRVRRRGRPRVVPLSVWNVARGVGTRRVTSQDRARLIADAPPGARRGTVVRQADLAAQRGRLARLTDHSVLGATAEEIGEFLALFRAFDVGVPLIRVGPGGDGTYLLPDDLDGIVACFSPGVSDVSAFEEELAHRGIRSFLADASVDGPVVGNPSFDFEKVFVGIDSRPGWTSLTDWVQRKAPGHEDLLLQMDIEGGEWPVLLDAPDSLLARIRIVVLELHGLHLAHLRSGLPVMAATMRKLHHHFVVVHTHPNNNELPVRYAGHDIPPVIEVTLLRRDRVTASPVPATLPHRLDTPNDPGLPNVAIPPEWRS